MALLRHLTTSLLLSGAVLAKEGRPTQYSKSCCSVSTGFDPVLAATQAKLQSNHSWEYGTTAEALYELYNPELTVFGYLSFPFGSLPVLESDKPDFPALQFAKKHIWLQNETLSHGEGAAGDPASLGQFAVLLGQNRPAYLNASTRQYEHLHASVPKWTNGAISHRDDYAELWADNVYMVPPFLAYYGAAMNNTSIIMEAVDQCMRYRQVLRSETAGLWSHIVGPKNQDLGFWSTGNGWAAMGMARVLATLMHWPPTATDDNARVAQADLFMWIGEILQGAIAAGKDANGLLRNYLDDANSYGETSGTALLTAAVYRLAVLQNENRELFDIGTRGSNGEVVIDPVHPDMLDWADANLAAMAAHADKKGIAGPAVNPLDPKSRTPVTCGTAEGEAFLVMLYSARRDCMKASACSEMAIKPFVNFWQQA